MDDEWFFFFFNSEPQFSGKKNPAVERLHRLRLEVDRSPQRKGGFHSQSKLLKTRHSPRTTTSRHCLVLYRWLQELGLSVLLLVDVIL